MRKLATLLGGWGTALAMISGCASTQPNLRPPKQAEVYNLPPDSESRFSEPMKYPEGTPKVAKGPNRGPIDPSMTGMSTGGPSSFSTGNPNSTYR